ncbi:MAG: alpha/beta hydrolase [Bacteroidales bacterium]|nr:alpha/beta hydrolase [Bacteroidales bacterium]
MEGYFLQINDKDIYYEFRNEIYLDNSDSVLVFLHEGLGSVAQWKDFPNSLSDKLKMPVLIYDRYGYGKSTMLSEKRLHNYLEIEALEWLPKIIKKLIPDNKLVILIGHSDGGSIALLYAAQFPSKVKAIITEAAHVFTEEITYKGLEPVANLFYKAGLREKLEKYHGEKTLSMFHGWYDVWTDPEFTNWNVENYLTSIICPVLAMQGKDDEYGSINQLQSLENNIKSNCRIRHIDNCGHTPHFQQREICEKEMINFINNLRFL